MQLPAVDLNLKMRKYTLILFLSIVFTACKNDKEGVSENAYEVHKVEDATGIESSIDTANAVWSNKAKRYSQEEIVSLLKNNTLKNQIIIDTNLHIDDTFKIGNRNTGKVNAYALFYPDELYCFKKDEDLYFSLNNFFYTYTSDTYYLKIKNMKVSVLFDSINMRHSCFSPGFNSTLKRYKITLNKQNYSIGDTLKCRALFINKGRYNGDAKDSIVYFLDSIDAKYIVHQYNKQIAQYISRYPK